MSSQPDLHHLAAAYALDALDADERIAFEAHYHDCSVCSHDVGDFRATVAALGELAVTIPPADLKALVLQHVATTRQLSPVVNNRAVANQSVATSRRAFMLAAAAAVLLIVATSAFVVGRGSQNDNAFAAQLEEVMAQSDVRIVDLTAISPGTSGHIHVAWSSSMHQAAVIGDGLLSPTDGSVYELWLIDVSGPVPTQLLDAAGGGDMRRILNVPGTPMKWGITIEPAGGSTTPTGEILFLADA